MVKINPKEGTKASRDATVKVEKATIEGRRSCKLLPFSFYQLPFTILPTLPIELDISVSRRTTDLS